MQTTADRDALLKGVYAPLVRVVTARIDEWNSTYGPVVRAVVVAGSRLYSQELIYYMQGRYILMASPIVTHALPEQSMHVPLRPGDDAYAIDIGFQKSTGEMDYTPSHYAVFASPELLEHVEWGGSWPAPKTDAPHLEVRGYSWQDRLSGKAPPVF